MNDVPFEIRPSYRAFLYAAETHQNDACRARREQRRFDRLNLACALGGLLVVMALMVFG